MYTLANEYLTSKLKNQILTPATTKITLFCAVIRRLFVVLNGYFIIDRKF